MKINFNRPVNLGNEFEAISKAIVNQKLSGDGEFGKKCQALLEIKSNYLKALMTPSCTDALEMSAILADIKEGDEVIMSDFTFPSTANAFVLRGAKIAFVDIKPDTMNIDTSLIEEAITEKTKAIVPMHYAGVGCEMEKIMDIANKYNLIIIEDSAQCLMAKYKGRALGTFGDLGCLSFHETKNYQCGEGGALMINNRALIERAEIIREKGTNRQKFFRGEVDKYSWVDLGSSFLLSELQSAYLYCQLLIAEKINENRLSSWNRYYELLKPLVLTDYIDLPIIPEGCEHNGHIFYLKANDLNERDKLIGYLKNNGVMALFHYVPLATSEAGLKYGVSFTRDVTKRSYSWAESDRLLRLPMYYGLTTDEIDYVVNKIYDFFGKERKICQS